LRYGHDLSICSGVLASERKNREPDGERSGVSFESNFNARSEQNGSWASISARHSA
jgi:hypothetical protein